MVGVSLKLREIEEQLHRQLHALHEFPDERHASEENRQAFVTAWVDHVRRNVESLLDACPREIVDRNRPWELWIGIEVCKTGTGEHHEGQFARTV